MNKPTILAIIGLSFLAIAVIAVLGFYGLLRA